MRAILAVTIVLATHVACASADFTPATLLSGTQRLQFDSASSPDFSQDGRYVVFRGALAGRPGIYRRNLENGEVAIVASQSSPGATEAESLLGAPDAAAPSISEEGRYVSFTSTALLDPEDEGPGGENARGCPQVYVRDMDLAPTAPGAYVLASAVNGSSEGLLYEKSCAAGSSTQLVIGGSQAAAGVALSGNGQKLTFTVLSPSDLGGPCTGAPLKCPTEASQVAVRDLETRTTTLVSSTPAGSPTPGGGAFPSSTSEQRLGGSQVTIESGEPVASSAAISADGSTVAWQGTNVTTQVPSAGDVLSGMADLGGPALEVEPLWRRIGDGPTAPVKRLLDDANLNFYFSQSHENSQAVEGGALAPVNDAFIPPALDDDGGTVAVIANAPTAANEGSYSFIGFKAVPPTDAYSVEVGDGTGSVKVTALTATPNFAALNAITGGVGDMTISPDGSRVAFNTRRVSFALAPPTLVSPPTPEVASAYTYVANLHLGTLQRVTSTYDGSPPNGEPGQLSFSGDGLDLALASVASNLFYGDDTPGASQVYMSRETSSASQVPTQVESPLPLAALPPPAWVLGVTAVPEKDGSVLLDAYVPGAGKLTVRALSQIPAKPIEPVRSRGKHGRPQKVKASHGVKIYERDVAHGSADSSKSSEIRMRLRVSSAYRALVTEKNGLYCILDVSFSSRGHAPLLQEIPLTLRQAARKRSIKGKHVRKQAKRGKTFDNRPGARRKMEVAW